MDYFTQWKTSCFVVLVLPATLGLFAFSPTIWASETDTDVCLSVAKVTYKACKADVKDDYLINYGNCINTNDEHEKQICIKAAKVVKHDEKTLCKHQRNARNNICDLIGEAPYKPEINPSNFLDAAGIAANPNPYFPLTPGLIKTFRSGDETITVSVTDQTKQILGVTCIVVRDTVTINGELIEDTDDWYAQDIYGNVWYFGEIARNYEDGELTDLDGSWKSGRDSAQPGIIMHASPQVGQVYRQEYLLGEAEDMAEVLNVMETEAVAPAADCSAGCVVTRDFLPIEPDVNEYKYYSPGIGFILSTDENGELDEELVEIIYPM